MARSTFNLSRVYSALGVKSANVVPEVEPGKIVSTLSIGGVSTFAPQTTEARGIVTSLSPATPYSSLSYNALAVHSRAEGGIVIESLSCFDQGANTYFPSIHIAAAVPPAILTWTVREALSCGGESLASVCFQSGVTASPGPTGDTQIGPDAITLQRFSLATADYDGPMPPDFFEGIYVPVGGALWVMVEHLGGGNASQLKAAIRWREFPQGLGAP